MGSVDQDKNISFLLKELDALRNVNKKVQVHTFLSALWGGCVQVCMDVSGVSTVCGSVYASQVCCVHKYEGYSAGG